MEETEVMGRGERDYLCMDVKDGSVLYGTSEGGDQKEIRAIRYLETDGYVTASLDGTVKLW